MYIHDDAGLAFVAHPRTASHAVAQALLSIGFYGPFLGHHASRVEVGLPAGYQTFTTVRNHWDAVASWVGTTRWGGLGGLDLLRSGRVEDLAVTLNTIPWVGQHTLWHIHDDADHVLRYEVLDAALNRLLTLKGLPKVTLSRTAPTLESIRNGVDYRACYDEAARDYVARRFSDEIVSYQYEF